MSHVADSETSSRHWGFAQLPQPADTGQTPPAAPSPPPYYYSATRAAATATDTNTCLIVGLILGAGAIFRIAVMGILAAIMLPALSRAREAARSLPPEQPETGGHRVQDVCQRDPQQYWPPLSSTDSAFMFQSDRCTPST